MTILHMDIDGTTIEEYRPQVEAYIALQRRLAVKAAARCDAGAVLHYLDNVIAAFQEWVERERKVEL